MRLIDSPKISRAYDGRLRELWPIRCKHCNKIFYVPRHVISRRTACSRKCHGLLRRRRKSVRCDNCDKRLSIKISHTTKSGYQFCSKRCKDIAQCVGAGFPKMTPSHYRDGRASYRRRGFRQHGARCQRCGYSKNQKMLDIHHIGGRIRHDSKNLEVLCIWCHALQTRRVPVHRWNGKLKGVVV
jgi:hypothetical protein